MEKGIREDWTPEREKLYERLLAICTFAEQQLIMAVRDLMKYDQRTKAGKRANAQARLRLATCDDHELKVLAKLEIVVLKHPGTVENKLEELKQMRDKLRDTGTRRREE